MKSRLLLLFVLSLGISLSSCKKDDDDDSGDNNNNPTTGQGSMTLKYDGTSWSASLAVVATSSNGVWTVTGSDSGAKQCGLSVNNVTGPGTYTVGGNLTNPNMGRWTASTDPSDTYTTMLGQGSGTVTITELTDTHTKGTFEFTAKNTAQETITITSGTFSADISQ